MASSQTANLNTVAGLSGLFHDVYINKVKPHLDHLSPMAGLFRSIGSKGYMLIGKQIVFAAQLRAAGGAMATSGNLPDHQYQDKVQLNTTPTRAYVRRAVDEFVVARGVTPGVFEDFMADVQQQAVEAFERMQTRHIHGGSTAVVALCASRTSQTVVVLKDGYGHTGTNPMMFLEPGDILCWHDAGNNFAVGGAAKIASFVYSTKTVTFAGNFDDNMTTVTANDPISFATTTDDSADHFESERGKAPLGLRDILDPDAVNASYLGVTEATYPRIKPLRKTSSQWGETEFTDFIREIQASGNSPVTPDNTVMSCQGAVLQELARTLVSFTQIMGKGQTLEGGWDTVRLAGFDFVEDGYHTHDELMAHCLDDYVVADLDGEPSIAAIDGSEFSRLADFDGKEWYMRHYVQRWADRRNRSGTLKGISISNYDADQFAAVPR